MFEVFALLYNSGNGKVVLIGTILVSPVVRKALD